MNLKNIIPLGFVLIATALLAVGCGGDGDSASASGGGGGGKLSLVAYSTPKEAYEQIVPAFKEGVGNGTDVRQSYGNSGDQARAVIAGLKTDIVALSLEPDVTKLVKEKLVAPGWNAGPTKGIVTNSVVALVVRKGNPKKIRGWDDLVRDDVDVLTPNPFTSGGARWNVMGAYGAQIAEGRTGAQATDYLQRLFENVVVQDKSAREALQSFAQGKGDVLISYENEAITAQQRNVPVDYVVPDSTILIENPIAVTVKAGPQASKFVDYVLTKPAQRVFAEKGYRSVIPALVDAKRYPKPKGQFTIEKFGGWDAVMQKFFDPEDSVMQKVEEGLGVSTG